MRGSGGLHCLRQLLCLEQRLRSLNCTSGGLANVYPKEDHSSGRQVFLSTMAWVASVGLSLLLPRGSGCMDAEASSQQPVQKSNASPTPVKKDDLLQSLMDSIAVAKTHATTAKKASSDLPLTRHCIANAAALASPAVVHLTVTMGGHGFFLGQSGGSGFIIRSDGIVLTNAHVVAAAAAGPTNGTLGRGQQGQLSVTMADGRTFDAHVLCMDSLADIAVVKMTLPNHGTASPLPTVQLGASKSLRAGEWVVALGSPLHLTNTVTAGIVSCTDRKSSELGLRGAHTDYLQTDAAINVGNSGGPLVNLEGEVVGINCMKALAADGVGFAIPIDAAMRVVGQLAKHGRVIRPFVGMKMLELNPGILEQLQERDPRFPHVNGGVLVPQVIPGSPAEQAGIRAGDVIVGFAGERVTTSRQIIEALADNIGTEFLVEVVRRGGEKVEIKISPEELKL